MSHEAALGAIVVIEDSDEDYEVTQWALREAGVANPLHRCATAASIADLLGARSLWPAALAGAPPLLVLLDLNLPGADGRDILARLRRHPSWEFVPVIVVSTSRYKPDVLACYRLGAAGYLQKRLDLDAFAAAMRQVADYWFKTVVLPAFSG